MAASKKPADYKDYVSFLDNYKTLSKSDNISNITIQNNTSKTETTSKRSEIFIELNNTKPQIHKLKENFEKSVILNKENSKSEKYVSRVIQNLETNTHPSKSNSTSPKINKIQSNLFMEKNTNITSQRNKTIERKIYNKTVDEPDNKVHMEKNNTKHSNQIGNFIVNQIFIENEKRHADIVEEKQIIQNNNNKKQTNSPQDTDKNNPVIKRMAYGALRGMYQNYHDQANTYVGTLPKHMVKQNNGVQNIIETMASQGNLEKLNGRCLPDKDKE